MAGFGDNSTHYQRSATIPGGLRFEAGCYTACGDATLYIPTQLTAVVCIVCNSQVMTDVPCISSGYIKGTLSDDANGKIINYVAVGW